MCEGVVVGDTRFKNMCTFEKHTQKGEIPTLGTTLNETKMADEKLWAVKRKKMLMYLVFPQSF